MASSRGVSSITSKIAQKKIMDIKVEIVKKIAIDFNLSTIRKIVMYVDIEIVIDHDECYVTKASGYWVDAMFDDYKDKVRFSRVPLWLRQWDSSTEFYRGKIEDDCREITRKNRNSICCVA